MTTDCKRSVVLVVDDDESVLHALRRLIISAGFDARTFSTAEQLLASEIPESDACIVVDLHLPGMNALELVAVLEKMGREIPAVLISGTANERTLPLVRNSRAVAVLAKPVNAEVLLDAIRSALLVRTC